MRPIDADALMELARNHINRAVDCNDIARFPTIEAEPVVRCKDCMYKEVPKCCPYQISGFAVPDDWYCPMGVKKNAAD